MIPLQEETLFFDQLRARGLRATPERQALLRAIFAQPHHRDAEQILAAMSADGARISRATLYRNLDLLVDCGLVIRVALAGNRTVYERSRPGRRHSHLTCRLCGRILEFVDPVLEERVAAICRESGFEAEGPQIQVHGRCEACPMQPESGRR